MGLAALEIELAVVSSPNCSRTNDRAHVILTMTLFCRTLCGVVRMTSWRQSWPFSTEALTVMITQQPVQPGDGWFPNR
jgi:hypothetical protein